MHAYAALLYLLLLHRHAFEIGTRLMRQQLNFQVGVFMVVFLVISSAAPSCPVGGKLPVATRENISTAAASTRISQPQAEAWRRLLGRLRAGSRVNFLALGGSVMLGNGCHQGNLHFADCSYSARIARALRCKYYGVPTSSPLESAGMDSVGLTYTNAARGGSTTASSLPQLRHIIQPLETAPPDFVLIDYALNDATEAQDWAAAPTLHHHLAGNYSADDIVYATTETLLRYLVRSYPSTAFALVEGVRGDWILF